MSAQPLPRLPAHGHLPVQARFPVQRLPQRACRVGRRPSPTHGRTGCRTHVPALRPARAPVRHPQTLVLLGSIPAALLRESGRGDEHLVLGYNLTRVLNTLGVGASGTIAPAENTTSVQWPRRQWRREFLGIVLTRVNVHCWPVRASSDPFALPHAPTPPIKLRGAVSGAGGLSPRHGNCPTQIFSQSHMHRNAENTRSSESGAEFPAPCGQSKGRVMAPVEARGTDSRHSDLQRPQFSIGIVKMPNEP